MSEQVEGSAKAPQPSTDPSIESSYDAAMRTALGGFAASIMMRGHFFVGAGLALVRFYAILFDLVAIARRSGSIGEVEQEKVLALLDSAIAPPMLGHMGEYLEAAADEFGVEAGDRFVADMAVEMVDHCPDRLGSLIARALEKPAGDAALQAALEGQPRLLAALEGALSRERGAQPASGG